MTVAQSVKIGHEALPRIVELGDALLDERIRSGIYGSAPSLLGLSRAVGRAATAPCICIGPSYAVIWFWFTTGSFLARPLGFPLIPSHRGDGSPRERANKSGSHEAGLS